MLNTNENNHRDLANFNFDSQPSDPDPLVTVERLLGTDAVLIPIPAGQKAPKVKGWNQLRLEDTRTEEYRRELSKGNIGVLLGDPSNGLCAIDIDSNEAVEPFLKLNPMLAETVRSKGARGEQIWLRIKGEAPQLTKLRTLDRKDWGEWRATGGQSVIHGTHPNGMPYHVVCEGPIATLTFEQIIWPENLKLPWIKTPYDLLVDEEGEPFLVSERTGAISAVNHMHFAIRYATEHTVLFDDAVKEFFGYEPETGLWKRQTVETIKRQISDDIKRAAREQYAPQLLAKRNDSLLNGVTNLLKAKVERNGVFTKRQAYIHVKNGVLRLDTTPPRLESFSPEFYSRNQCPIAYDPDAECPKFIRELLKPALDDDDINLLQKLVGAILLGDNRAQRILLLTGTAGGGKSTLMNVIEEIIGRANVAHLRTNQLAERFELLSFDGKTLLTGKDVSPKFLMQRGSHVLKALVGHDHVQAEKKGANDRVSLFGNFNVVITCNSRLRVKLEGDTDAWRRRLVSIRYDKPKPKQRIASFSEVLLQEEGAGILSWMVEGAVLYLQEVEEHGDVRLTSKQQERVDAILAESDSVRQFLEHRVVPDETGTATTQELVNAYRDYCDEMEWEGYPDNEAGRQIPPMVLELFGVNRRHDIQRGGTSHRGYKGIALVR
ncbi:phage/plasmid primase, P4 family [Verrucomicrobiota bacterium sgz303538]